MERLTVEALDDPSLRVPEPPPAPAGMAWLRGAVVRFSEGEVHDRRRALVVELIDSLHDAPFVGSPTGTLLAGLGLPADLAGDVALVSAAYQPHASQSAAADAAADRLVVACGGRTEEAAARVCLLAQAHVAVSVLADRLRTGSPEPPLVATRRVRPDGTEVEVDLADAWFGRGVHRCPGEELARRLAQRAADA